MRSEPIIMERIYNAPVATVWRALTDPVEMKKWYFDVPEFQPKVGTKFQFLAGDEKKQYLHLCEVTEAIEEVKIAYTWRYEGYEGVSHVSFELFPSEGGKTKLVLTHADLDKFPAGAPELARENFVGGWTYFVDKALKEYLDTKS